jgi:hypothetical protein
MGRPVKLKTIEELEQIFRDDPGLALEISAKCMAARDFDMERVRESHRKYQRKKSLEKKLLKQAV